MKRFTIQEAIVALAKCKTKMIIAHRKRDYESAKVLSQQKEKLKRVISKYKECGCGRVIHTHAERCYPCYQIHRFYSKAIAAAVTLMMIFAITSQAQTSATLGWSASDSTNLLSYRVYWGRSSSAYSNTVTVPATQLEATISNLVAGIVYFAAATAIDNSSNESVFSNEVSWTNAFPLVINSHPSSQSVILGGRAFFQVLIAGTNPSYQWFRSGSPIPGATGSTFTIPAVVVSDAAVYTVVVSNVIGTVTSSPASLYILVLPAPPKNIILKSVLK